MSLQILPMKFLAAIARKSDIKMIISSKLDLNFDHDLLQGAREMSIKLRHEAANFELDIDGIDLWGGVYRTVSIGA